MGTALGKHVSINILGAYFEQILDNNYKKITFSWEVLRFV